MAVEPVIRAPSDTVARVSESRCPIAIAKEPPESPIAEASALASTSAVLVAPTVTAPPLLIAVVPLTSVLASFLTSEMATVAAAKSVVAWAATVEVVEAFEVTLTAPPAVILVAPCSVVLASLSVVATRKLSGEPMPSSWPFSSNPLTQAPRSVVIDEVDDRVALPVAVIVAPSTVRVAFASRASNSPLLKFGES